MIYASEASYLHTLGQKSIFYPKINMFKIKFLKNHISEAHFSWKIRFSKSYFSQKSHLKSQFFINIVISMSFKKITLFQTSNSSEFIDKKCDFAPVCYSASSILTGEKSKKKLGALGFDCNWRYIKLFWCENWNDYFFQGN